MAIAGYQSNFLVTAKDAWSNVVTNWHFNLTVWAYASQPVNGTVHNYHNGTCLVVYTPHSSGINLLSVTIGGHHIKGSPFSVRVEDGDDKAIKSTATGTGLYTNTAGEVTTIVVQARDAYGNQRTTGVNHSPKFTPMPMFNLTMAGPGRVVNTSAYSGSNGQHILHYNATKAGVYNLTIQDTVTGQAIVSSPFYPVIRPGMGDPLNSYLSGSGIMPGVAGVVKQGMIHSVDRFGNTVDRSGDLYLATLIGPFNCTESCDYDTSSLPLGDTHTLEGLKWMMMSKSRAYNNTNGYHPYDAIDWDNQSRGQAIPVLDMGNGTYRFQYTPLKTGTYKLQVKMGVAGSLWGTYYGTRTFTIPMLGRQEPSMNFTSAWNPHGPDVSRPWGNASRHTIEGFSFIVRGFVKPPLDGEYLFYATADSPSEVEVTLGNETVIDGATGKMERTSNRSIILSKDQLYEIVLKYQHLSDSDPLLTLEWYTVLSGRMLVPSVALYLFYQVSNFTHTTIISPAPLYPPASNASGHGLVKGEQLIEIHPFAACSVSHPPCISLLLPLPLPQR